MEDNKREGEEAEVSPRRGEEIGRRRAEIDRKREEKGPEVALDEEILSIGGAAPTGATKATEDEPPQDQGPLVASSEGQPGEAGPSGR